MFGSLTVSKNNLTEENRQIYREYYCGLCRILKKKFGSLSELLLTFDGVFLAILLSSLYVEEEEEEISRSFCAIHVKKVTYISDEAISYAADMSLLLSYYNYSDRVHDRDENKKNAKKAVRLLKKTAEKVAAAYPRQSKAIETYLKKLQEREEAFSQEPNPDYIANLTGEMLSEIFVKEEDFYSENLRTLGFFVGKFIYCLDGYIDVEKDRKRKNYNPYSAFSDREDFDSYAENHLLQIIANGTQAFEALPIVRNAEILRNILYSGIWISFGKAKKERKK